MRTFWVIVFICGLLLTGCGDKDTTTSTKPAPAPPAKPTVTEQVKKTADTVAKQATEIVENSKQLVKETAADAKQAVKKVVKTAAQNVTTAAVVAKKKTSEIVETSKEKVVEVKDKIKQEGTQLLDGVQKDSATSGTKSGGLLAGVATVASAVVAPAKKAEEVKPSEFIVIENKKGNVTLPHAAHGENYGCETCHGEGTPSPFELGKKTAHTLCKDCHKKDGGPTKCSGCHKK